MLSLVYALFALPLATPILPSDTLTCGTDAAALTAQAKAIMIDSGKNALEVYQTPRLNAHFQRCYVPFAAQVNAASDKLSLVQYFVSMRYVAYSSLASQAAKALDWPVAGEQAKKIGEALLDIAVLARDHVWATSLSKQYQLTADIAPALPADAFAQFGRLVLVNKNGQRQWQHFRFPAGPAIVLVTYDGCGFNANFQQYLQTQPALAKVFASFSIQIASVGMQLSENPAIYDVYQHSQWPEIDIWDSPVFYFYLDGRLQGSVIGWPKEGRVAELKEHLERIGL